MRSIFTYVGSLMAVAAAGLLAGCASNGGNGGGRHEHLSGMACPTCETVWVQESGTAGSPKVTAMRWGRQMTCPDCDAMAKAYFQDGEKVLHDCPTCKVAPRPARPESSAPSHPKGTHT